MNSHQNVDQNCELIKDIRWDDIERLTFILFLFSPIRSRFLRNHDRSLNSYPSLHYPEVYLLHGGYKDFFENNADLCEPHEYRSMIDASFADDYKHFRAKTKTWNGDIRSTAKLTKSRSRLML